MSPQAIIERAVAQYAPIATFVGFSGGNDSLAVTHWMMRHVPGCRPFHINTGIGIERTRQFVRDVCELYGWPLIEIHAKDCGQDYDELCKLHGFPGPGGHGFMYRRLKERGIDELMRRAKVGHARRAKVMLATGLRHDESVIRMGYAGREVNKHRGKVWVNPIYWWTRPMRDVYNALFSCMPLNPVSRLLGMSGECGCGAYAQPGELARWRAIDPEFGRHIDQLQAQCMARGFTWGWEGRPPRGGFKPQPLDQMPMCVGCEKSAVVQAELEEA